MDQTIHYMIWINTEYYLGIESMVEFCILDYKDIYARFFLDLDTVALVKEMAYKSQYLMSVIIVLNFYNGFFGTSCGSKYLRNITAFKVVHYTLK